MRKQTALGILMVLALALVNSPAGASLIATSTISRQQLGPSSFEYSLTLTNTGTTAIGTFWVGWLPGYDLLPSAPSSILPPAGWTGADAGDSFGVASAQFVNTTTPLQPGHSLGGFTFITPDSNVATGTSFIGEPIDFSYVYIGAPETDAGFALTPSVVTPEPSSVALLAISIPLLLRRKRQ